MAAKNPIISLDSNTILIVGGGPVGLLAGTALAHYGIKSVILERNDSTTKWPKMDLTNVRSMELLRKLGLAEEIRKIGVPSTTPYNVYMTTGLHNEEPITSWENPSVDDLRAQYRETNDGTCPLEPWQRVSQAVFEKYLKARCDENDLIDCRFGWKVEKSVESEDGVFVEATQLSTNQKTTFFTKYLLACDGASSRIRRDMEIPLDGGPVPGYALLVHFKSQDLEKLFKFGKFWHYFVFSEQGLTGAVICQDDKEIFTTHLLLPLDAEHESIESHDAVHRVLGGLGGPFEIEIDEILVRSTYRHSIAVARTYRSRSGRVFLVGDSAHQNIPTGGYGMNMGIGDAFDIAWKLAMVIQGKGGKRLLDSYEQERRPIALQSVERSGVHMQAHMAVSEFLSRDPDVVEHDSPEGRTLRAKIHEHYQKHNGENLDIGIEMDHRHKSIVYPQSVETEAPHWDPAHYTPNTCVGSRAPHVFLNDGTPIFDVYGQYWTLVQFFKSENASNPRSLLDEARRVDMPIKHVILEGEDNARRIWEVPLILVRPDGHVAWRGQTGPSTIEAAEIIQIVTGKIEKIESLDAPAKVESAPFSATSDIRSQIRDYELERMGAMQT